LSRNWVARRGTRWWRVAAEATTHTRWQVTGKKNQSKSCKRKKEKKIEIFLKFGRIGVYKSIVL
jgi:hypothetical protein